MEQLKQNWNKQRKQLWRVIYCCYLAAEPNKHLYLYIYYEIVHEVQKSKMKKNKKYQMVDKWQIKNCTSFTKHLNRYYRF